MENKETSRGWVRQGWVWFLPLWSKGQGLQPLLDLLPHQHYLKPIVGLLLLGLGSLAIAANTFTGSPLNLVKPGDDDFDWGPSIRFNMDVINSSFSASGLGGAATTYVDAAGDMMTGSLSIGGGSLTVTGHQGVLIDYGVIAGSMAVRNGLTASSGTFLATGNTQWSIVTSSGIRVLTGGVTAAFFDGLVSTPSIPSGSIDTNKLQTDAVTTAKILYQNVDTTKIKPSSVDTDKIMSDAVTSDKLWWSNLSLRRVSGGGLSMGSGGEGNSNTGTNTGSLAGGGTSTTNRTYSLAFGSGNTARSDFSAVFGKNNTCGGSGATDPVFCGGGEGNTYYGPHGFGGSGYDNQMGTGCTKCVNGGGESNRMNGTAAYQSNLGGISNTLGNSGYSTSICGGNCTIDNSTDGSLVAGRRARSSHTGSFVWNGNAADSTRISSAPYSSTFQNDGGMFVHNALSTTTVIDVYGRFGFPVHTEAAIHTMPTPTGKAVMCQDCANPYTICVGTGATAGMWREQGTTTGCY